MVIEKILADEDLRDRRWRIKMIVEDPQKANALAEKMPDNIMILRGNPTDPDLLNLEGFSDSDAYLALTADEESNIISCLMAKHLQARKVVALISKKDYINISQTIGLDAAVNTKLAAANAIHRYIRRGNVLSITSLHGIAADAVELEAEKGSKVDGKPIKKLEFPGNSVVGAVTRHDTGEIEIASGETVIRTHDRVIIFTQPKNLAQLADMFR
jgi:trk system potassium uptake protein TrkA